MAGLSGDDALAVAIGLMNKKISDIGGGINYIGITTSPISDGSTTNPITINGESYTALPGDLVNYEGVYFIFDKDGIWNTYSETIIFKDAGVIFN